MSDDLNETKEIIETYSGFIAIVGKPNVGKSTLLNNLLGVKVAPISSKPQTTRTGIRGIYTQDNKQLVFIDTPGFHKAHDALGDFMNRQVRNNLEGIDATLWLVDLRRPPNDEDRSVARLLKKINNDVPIYLIANKVEVAKYPEEALELYQDLFKADRTYVMSALNDVKAVYALRDDLLKIAPKNPFFFPDNIRSDQSRENWAGEIVRESAMAHLRQELPYAIAVVVDEWRDPKNKNEPIYIHAEIWVERINHRRMVIGRGGKMIKEIGRMARKQLETLLAAKVYLDMEVVVHKDWREDMNALIELGYAG